MSTTSNNPYIGPRTFLKEEGHLFFGRDRESRDLASLVVSERLVLFYAQSGAGKSSLINTRLIPDLESNHYEILPVGRVSGDLPAGININNIYTYNLMRSLMQREIESGALAELTLSHFLDRLNSDEQGYFYNIDPSSDIVSDKEITLWRRMLIIDQFEEVFSTHPEAWEKRGDFFSQLAQSMQDNPYLWIVLVMREDYIAALDPYAHLLPGGLRVRYYMQRLGWEAALKAVKSPVENLRPYAENVAEKLVENLASIKVRKPDGSLDVQPGQYVEPVQLQVVCYSLWENLASARPQITEDDLREVGDVNQSLEKFYDGRVNSVAKLKRVEERLIREWFDNELITGGIRNMVLQGQNHVTGGLSDDVIQALQGDLVRAEMRAGQIWYELSHDRLIEPIQSSNMKWYAANLSVFQQQAALWVAQGRSDGMLLRGHDLEQAKLEAESKTITRDERDFLSACIKAYDRERGEKRRNRLVQILAILAFILFFAAASSAIQANNQTKAAKTALYNAESSAATATIALGEAKHEKARADSASGFREADRLALEAQSALGQTVSLGQLLAVEAYRVNSKAVEDNQVNSEAGEILTGVYQVLFDSVGKGYDKNLGSGTFSYAAFGTGANEHWLILDNILWDLQDVQSFRLVDTDKILQSAFRSDEQVAIVTGETGYYSDGGNVYIKDKTNRIKNQFTLTVPESTYITDIKLSGNGKWVAAAYSRRYSYGSSSETNGFVQLWDTTNSSPAPKRLPIQSQSVDHVAIAQDGTKLAAVDDDKGLLYVWLDQSNRVYAAQLNSGYAIGTMTGKAGNGLQFSRDGRWLAVLTEKGIQIYDMNSLYSFIIPLNEGDNVSGFLFSPDSDSLIYVTSNYQYCENYYYKDDCIPAASVFHRSLANTSNQADKSFFTDADANITAMDIGDNGIFVIGDSAGYVRTWNLGQDLGDPSFVVVAHAGKVASILAGSDNETIVSSGEKDGTRLWKLTETVSPAIVVHRTSYTMSNLIRTPDGSSLIVGGVFNKANTPYLATRVFSNLESPTSINELPLYSSQGSLQAFAMSSQWIAAARMVSLRNSDTVSHFLDLWDLNSADSTTPPITVPTSLEIKTMAFAQNGSQLGIATANGEVWIDSLNDLKNRNEALTPISNNMRDESTSNNVQIPFGTELPNGLTDIQSLIFAGNDRYLIGASTMGVHVWDMEDQTEYEIKNSIFPARISPDQKWMVTASSTNAFHQYNVEGILSSDPTIIYTDAVVTNFAFSSDGDWLAVAIKSGKVQIYAMPITKQSEPVYSLQGPSSVTSLEFSSAQSTKKWLVASSGNYAYLWNIDKSEAGTKTQNDNPITLQGQRGNLVYAGFTNDGKWIITAAGDQTLRFWSMEPEKLLEAICTYANRNLTPVEWKLLFEGERHKTCLNFPLEEEAASLVASPTSIPGPIISVFYTVTPTPTPAEIFADYKVQTGDNLGLISLKFGVSLQTLMEDNGIVNSNLITAGQVLKIRTANIPTQP